MPKNFNKQVWALLEKIPRGRVSTYKQIAIALRKPNAARAVGNACYKNPFAPKVPCHRIVKSSAEIGGYAKGAREKARLLESEGIEIKNSRIKNFDKVLFKFE